MKKLIRDNIPEIIKQNNQANKFDFITANHNEFEFFVKEKIKEEINELLNAKDKQHIIEEFGDVFEILDTFKEFHLVDKKEIDIKRTNKGEKNGLFYKRIIMQMNSDFCCFCNDLKQHKKKAKQDYDLENIILFETDNFVITPDLHPIKIGHILIIPKKHYTSYGYIDKVFEIEYVLNYLQKVFNVEDYILFEHGSVDSGNQVKQCGNSIYHAHWHFIPTNKEIDLYNIVNQFDKIDIKNNIWNLSKDVFFSKELNSFFSEKSYILLKNKNNLFIALHEFNNSIPSQFLRKFFAEYFKNDFWDWKNINNEKTSIILKEKILQTILSFK